MKFLTFILLHFVLLAGAQNRLGSAEKLFPSGKFTQAKPLFEEIVKETPNYIKALEYLGDINGLNKPWDNYMKYYTKLKQLIPKEAVNVPKKVFYFKNLSL